MERFNIYLKNAYKNDSWSEGKMAKVLQLVHQGQLWQRIEEQIVDLFVSEITEVIVSGLQLLPQTLVQERSSFRDLQAQE